MSNQRTKPQGDDDPRVIACIKAKRHFGNTQGLGDRLGHSRQAVDRWQIIPPTYCIAVELATGISRYEQRPDVFGTVEENVLLQDIATAARLAIKSIELAAALGITIETLAEWDQVPPERVRDVERLTGISRHTLRPDVFGQEPDIPPRRIKEPADNHKEAAGASA